MTSTVTLRIEYTEYPEGRRRIILERTGKMTESDVADLLEYLAAHVRAGGSFVTIN